MCKNGLLLLFRDLYWNKGLLFKGYVYLFIYLGGGKFSCICYFERNYILRRAAPSSATLCPHCCHQDFSFSEQTSTNLSHTDCHLSQPNVDIFPPQFCTTIRKIVFSRLSALLTALCGVCTVLYVGCVTPLTFVLVLLVSFTIWMAA